MSRSLFLSLLLFAACKSHEPEEALPKPQVRVVTTALSKHTARLAIAGVLTPLPGRDVKVGSLVAGRVTEVYVAEGDVVKKGQALAHIDAQPLRDRVTEADAQRSLTHSALDNAKTRLARAEKLFADGITSRQDVDDARAALVAAQSAVQQAQAGSGTATTQLDRATLRSPIDGVVAAILVPAGQPVDGNATPVIEIADAHELDLRAPIPASLAGQVTIGQKAEVVVDGAPIAGRVVTVAPIVDTTTNTVAVRVRIDNANGKLRGGLFVRGAVLGAEHDGVVIPRSALLPGDGGDASVVAIVDKDGAISHETVVIRSEGDTDVEVELEAGLRVVVAGGYSLPDDTKVEVVP